MREVDLYLLKSDAATRTITIKDGQLFMDSKFDVKVADHKIKVPSLYVENIAENIQVTFHADMALLKK